jgi:hypothetical protein
MLTIMAGEAAAKALFSANGAGVRSVRPFTTSADASTLRTPQLVALVGAVFIGRLLAISAVPLYDDAFITFRFARNLAAGKGMIFNPGAPWEPVLGTTAPGYAVILAAFGRFGLDPYLVARVLNAACDAGSAWLLASLLRRSVVATTIALAAFATTPIVVRISAGGMEPPLLLLLTVGAVAAGPALGGWLAALACTVRPEAIVLVATMAWRHRGDGTSLRSFLVPVAAVGIGLGMVLLVVYGTLVPHTVVAKSVQFGANRPDSLVAAWSAILRGAFVPAKAALLLIPVVAVGMDRGLRSPATRPVAVFALLVVIAYLAARPAMWSWYYYVPLAAWAMALGLGSEALLERMHDRRPITTPAAVWGVAVLALALTAGAAAFSRESVTARVYDPMKRWAQHVRPDRHITILTEDLGAIAYYARDATVVDTGGLVWPPAVGSASWVPLADAHDPDYLLLIAKRGNAELMRQDPRVRERYAAIARFSAAGHTALNPDAGSLPDSWSHDYLLYKRREGQ